MANPPTELELNPVLEDLDGRVVVRHLLGKTVDEAVALLEENSIYYQEDYTWMGARAFCYYCPALIRYLHSHSALEDGTFAYGLLSTFKHRLDHDGLAIAEAFPVIEEFCAAVEHDAARLGFDDDLEKRARRRIAEVRAALRTLKSR